MKISCVCLSSLLDEAFLLGAGKKHADFPEWKADVIARYTYDKMLKK